MVTKRAKKFKTSRDYTQVLTLINWSKLKQELKTGIVKLYRRDLIRRELSLGQNLSGFVEISKKPILFLNDESYFTLSKYTVVGKDGFYSNDPKRTPPLL